MEARLKKTGPAQMTVVEIYETGEKKYIPAKQITKNSTRLNRSIIITAAEYRSYRASMW